MAASSPHDHSSSSTCDDSSTQTPLVNPSELAAQHPLPKMESHPLSYKPLADGPLTPSKFTSKKTLFLSRHCYSAKLHALHQCTSTLWTPEQLTDLFPPYLQIFIDFSTPYDRLPYSTFPYDMNVLPTHACTLLFALAPHITHYVISSRT